MNHATLANSPGSNSATKAATPSNAQSNNLRIGEPNDAFEREADQMAGAVMAGNMVKKGWYLSRMNIGASSHQKRDYGESRASEHYSREEKATLQRCSADYAPTTRIPAIVHEVLNSDGAPLDPGTRRLFEPLFGHDFSEVRICTDDKAARSAEAVSAQAYAVSDKIVFNRGKYAPGSAQGKQLLAHELAHVVQRGPIPILRRQPNDQTAGGGAIGPLVQKFLKGEATPEEKAILQRRVKAGQLTPEEKDALLNHLQDGFRTAVQNLVAPLVAQQGQITAIVGGPVGNIHTFFKAGLRLRLEGAAKMAASGLEGTVETTIEVNGDADKKAVEVTITPPAGDTSLATLIRAKVFPNGPLSIQLGEVFLKAINMISLTGQLTITFTGNKSTESGGLVISSPLIPDGVELEATLSQSSVKPQTAPATGSPALPPPRAFVTGGVATAPKQTSAATTAGFDLPLATDTKNPFLYGGVGFRAGADTRGDLTAGGVIFSGAHLSPLTLQVAIEAGVARSPQGQTSANAQAATSAYYGIEASVGVQVLKHVEVLALVSAIGGSDVPVGESVQAGVGITF